MTTPSVATLVHESLGERVYKSLRDHILSQAYPPGSKLNVEQLCRNLGVSRTLVWDVIKNRRGILSVDAASDKRFDGKRSIKLLGIRSVVCVPMIAGDEVRGTAVEVRASRLYFKSDPSSASKYA